ncbi:tRNA pseudouridine(38-40) synthase TruA [Natronosporangium hydrolyticum]|uniref:tRNA pseudouridine synthase A n=1 Tax=Natronosporangium hydrolyticum TaxID=2811111 RepID=A0A895YHM8_9ACTN|nr:tRNA pseudouridine(38-40) synthase TruA [Natronosporangium hydrolyticum]QSB15545.1 tRNA pseudouridine(38-40) synthase TruA [Natronosporangium hydrolyticum]
MTDGRVRVRLDVAYDGTDFHGWAVQQDRRTVAGVLLVGLRQLLGDEGAAGLTVAGRTDAGVHATGQVAHVDVIAPAWQTRRGDLLRRLAGVLPPDVRVTAATEVGFDFDARFSALSRRYEYRVSDAPYGVDPLRRHDTLRWRWPLELARLNQAAAGLVGEHDFAAYCRRNPNRTTVRAITELAWRRDPDGVLVATVAADAFCQSMVRSLVGGMLLAGDGTRPVEWPAQLLTRRERAGEVRVVGPHGLTLVAVGYPDPEAWAARALATRRVRTLTIEPA